MTVQRSLQTPRARVTHAQVRAMHSNAYTQVSKSWGGCTIDLSTTQAVTRTDGYGVSLRPWGMQSVSIAEDASYETFTQAFNTALITYGVSPYLGIFHDDKRGTIEFDPVDIVGTLAEVDALGTIYPVSGGAYSFATGEGYWPNATQLDDVDVMS